MQRFVTSPRFSLAVWVATTAFCLPLAAQVNSAGKPKPFAEGVLKVIKPDLDARDSYSLPMPLPGLNATDYSPNFLPKNSTLYGQTRNIVFFRDVWQYEFSFLGLRQVEVNGKNVWYLVYRVRNTGATLTYQQVKEDPRFDHLKNELRRNEQVIDVENFLPRFSLEGSIKTDTGV